MTNEDTQLMHQMRDYLKTNLTHAVVVHKAVPGSRLPELQKQATADHKDVVNRLMLDQTKTNASKRLFAAKNAEKEIMKLLKQVDSEKGNAFALRAHLETKVSEILSPEEPNPTDALTRITMLQNIRNMKFTEVLSLLRGGDQETAKCLQLPLARSLFKLDGARAKSVRDATEKTLLSETEYKNLMLSRQADAAYLAMGDGLAALAGRSIEIQRVIEESIVTEEAA